MDYSSSLALLTSLFLGIGIGVIVEHFRFKNDMKLERIKILSPILCEVYPIVELIVEDTEYALNIRQRHNENEFLDFINTVTRDLDKYKMWDEKYREAGLKLFLRNFNDLIECLDEMRIYSITTHLKGGDYVIGILEQLHKLSKKYLVELNKF